MMLIVTLLTLTGCSTSDAGPNDGSVNILHSIFGVYASNALSQSPLPGHLIFSQIFKYFNTALLAGGGLIFAYMLIMGTLYTAQDGVFLGKKWSKTLIPLRAIIGVISIVPVGSSGFCFAQWVVYFMAFVGISIANHVWLPIAPSSSSSNNQPSAAGIPLSVQSVIRKGVSEIFFDNAITNTINANGGNPSTTPPGNIPGITPTVPGLSNKKGTIKVPVVISNRQPSAVTLMKLANNKIFYVPSNINTICNTLNSSAKADCLAVSKQVTNNMKTEANYPTVYATPASVSIPFGQNLTGLNAQPSSNCIPTAAAPYYQKCTASEFISGGEMDQTRLTYAIPSNPNNYVAYNVPDNTSTSPIVISAKNNINTFTSTVLYRQIQAGTSITSIIGIENSGAEASFMKTVYQPILASVLNQKQPNSTYLATPTNGTLAPPSGAGIPQANTSWWNAGNEYLTLDLQFANAAMGLDKVARQFLSNVTKQGFTETENIGDATYTLTFQHAGIGNPFLWPIYGLSVQKPVETSTNSGKFAGKISPAANDLQLGTFATQLYTAAKTWTNTTQKGAAYDLACKMGDATACVSTSFNSNPAAYTSFFTQIPDIAEHLQYYFSFRQYLAKNGYTENGDPVQEFVPAQIKQIDTYLTFAHSIFEAPGNIPNNTGNSYNPMVIAGENSPMRNTMGFLFSGLIGNSYGTQNIGGLMQQVWCVGMPHSLTECPYTQGDNDNPTPPKLEENEIVSGYNAYAPLPKQSVQLNDTTNNQNLVADHFDVIRSTQLVGLNLISGSVDAMTKIYQNFSKKAMKIVSDAKSSNISTFDVVAAGAVGPVASTLFGNQTSNAQVEAIVAMASLSVTLMWLPVIFVVLTTLFVTGIMFAILIPITPYILYWSGKIAWLLLVLEALVAAPVAALGIAYPDGHDLWGMAENGFKISLNLLLLPVLLIIGLVSSMVLTYFVIHFSAVGFHWVSSSLLTVVDFAAQDGNISLTGNNNSIIVQGIMATFIIFMYATFISMAFNKCFSTIYIIPEKVMGWIGGQGMKFGKEDGEKMSQATNQMADKTAQAGGQTVSQGTQAQKSMGEASINANATEQQNELKMAEAVGSSAKAAGQAAMGGG